MSETPSEDDKDSWTKWLFRISLIFTLGAPLFFGVQGEFSIMTVAVAAGAIGMVFCSLGKIALFKAGFKDGAIEIQTFKDALRENTETIERIKALAAALSKPLLGMIAAGERYGGRPAEKEIVAGHITNYLDKIGCSQSQVEDAMSEYYVYRIWDHAQHIEWSCEGAPNSKITTALESLKDSSRFFVSMPEVYREKLRELNLLDKYSVDAIDDYEHFIQHKKLRRPDVWLKPRREQEEMMRGDT